MPASPAGEGEERGWRAPPPEASRGGEGTFKGARFLVEAGAEMWWHLACEAMIRCIGSHGRYGAICHRLSVTPPFGDVTLCQAPR